MRGSIDRFLAVALTLFACAGPAAAQPAYPNKAITIILPYAPGGATSALAYLIRQKLSESWGHQAIMLHRPGGNATVGAAVTAKSAPDGYTIMVVTTTHIISPLLMPVSYDPIKDFAAITPVTNVEVIVVSHPVLPVKNLKELIAIAKARPGKLNYATSSAGSASHLAAELFSIKMDIRMQNIAYKGGGPAVTDTLGGQVELMFGNPINVVHHIQAGRLRGLAISGERRLPSLPQVPTFSEGGVSDFNVGFWQGVLAPGGTPRAIVDTLAAEIGRIIMLPDIKEKLAAMGVEPYIAAPDQFAARMRLDTAKYAEVIKKRNIKIE
jgi:tripartite-type tricarboxylate transporter receptor subunit TctC